MNLGIQVEQVTVETDWSALIWSHVGNAHSALSYVLVE